MFLKIYYCSAILLLVSLSAASQKRAVNDSLSTGEDIQVKAVIDISKTYQTIDNFGASDAWSCQFVGNWPDAKRRMIADLLFSMDTTSGGQPKGIGLSAWRFNIGAGSTQQGDKSGIKDEWRRSESFLNNDGTYDWQRQGGQLWFLKAAKNRGVSQFIAFTNSPPFQLTINGKTYADQGKPNLSPDKYDEFARFLSDVIVGIKNKTGVTLNYISPVNEPQWDWSDGGQEGSPFTNVEIAGIVRVLDQYITRRKLPVKITIPEAGQIDFLYSDNGKPERGNQIDNFFSKNSPGYIGNLPNVDKVISAHSYFTTSLFEQAITKRKQLALKVSSIPELKYWMSEYCILGGNAGEINGNKRDLGIYPALYVARTIYMDLATANATAWQWWLAVSPYDYKDGLIYIDKNKTDGNIYPGKMLWALGNYSRFIRPGYKRVDVLNNNKSVQISSFTDDRATRLIIVVVNGNSRPASINLKINHGKVRSMEPYITSATSDLKPGAPVSMSDRMVIPERSVTTLIGEIQ